MRRTWSVAIGLMALLPACRAPGTSSCPCPVEATVGTPPRPDASAAPRPAPGDPVPRTGDEIVVCGERFHTGTRVVLWGDPGGYDAYRPHRRFAPEELLPSEGKEVARYGTLRRRLPEAVAARVREEGWRLEDLRQVVGQVVLHYDASGTSAQAFEVLHDRRGLSAHFLLDVDGTIYQTLDVKERAWHAGTTNDASVGIELANIGAYPDRAVLDDWYVVEEGRSRLAIPPGIRRGALPDGLVARPAREGPIVGVIHGQRLLQQDYTPAQYEALAHLLAALSVVLPRCRLEAPRDADGTVLTGLLAEGPPRENFEGVLGHWHVSAAKVDPGPALRWDAVLGRARALRAPGSDAARAGP